MTNIGIVQIKSDNANWLQRYLHEEGPEKSFKSKWNWTDLISEKAFLSSCVWQGELIASCFTENRILGNNGKGGKGRMKKINSRKLLQLELTDYKEVFNIKEKDIELYSKTSACF